MRVFYSHPRSTYATPQEMADNLALRAQGYEVVNLNSSEHEPANQRPAMRWTSS